jgi:hypothetical protein
MLQNSGSVTTRTKPPLSPAEREQRYQQVLRELRDPKFYQIRITGMLLKRGYLWPNERDDFRVQKVILRDQALEVRNVDGRLHIARTFVFTSERGAPFTTAGFAK